MSKYLELVEGSFNESHFSKQTSQNPYVAYSIKDGKVIYSIIGGDEPDVDVDLTSPYIMFKAQEDNSSIGLTKLSSNQTLEYSMDTTIWNTFKTTTNISLNNGDKLYVRGMLSTNNSTSNYTQFKMTGKIAASGNCNALWNYQDLNATLKEYCGYRTFYVCKSLTTAPELPATELTKSCYFNMFRGCTALTTAPGLPATTLAQNCYKFMFDGCTSLTTAPEILPATTLTNDCYVGMFSSCASLTTAPVLPATTLAWYCYNNMFYGCTSLNHITCLATDKSADHCTSFWLDEVSSTGTFVKHPDMNDWTTGDSGIPSGWKVEDAVL